MTEEKTAEIAQPAVQQTAKNSKGLSSKSKKGIALLLLLVIVVSVFASKGFGNSEESQDKEFAKKSMSTYLDQTYGSNLKYELTSIKLVATAKYGFALNQDGKLYQAKLDGKTAKGEIVDAFMFVELIISDDSGYGSIEGRIATPSNHKICKTKNDCKVIIDRFD